MRSEKITIGWRWFVLFSAIALVFFLFAFGREYVGNLQVQREIALLEEQKVQQEQTQLETMDLIDQLSSEYYLEQEGRVKQGLGKEGETVVIIQDGISIQDGKYGEGIGESSITNIVRWFYYFFNHEKFITLADYEGI